MQGTKIALFLFAAMGAVASPIEAGSGGLDARAENAVNKSYPGKCYVKDNICKYTFEKKTRISKCPKARNLSCPKDKAPCEYESYDGSVKCDYRKK